ncbi:hypothetical protein LJB42_002971 [Komagataella kurtzmanii]|nr:hypothetical protein LJB42_002971 [Komagataella kurtzmanii]
MGKLAQLVLHPLELRAAIQFKFFKQSLHPRDPTNERETLKHCYELLALTSRSFCTVILELNPELRYAIMIFYLVLRALDTVEDDMTIKPDIKIPLLRSFDEKLNLKSWSFDGNSPDEKDRQVLVDFTDVLEEYHRLKPVYQDVIKDITHKMGNGMADYITDEEFNLNGVATVKDYDLYCHYVAGLVGEGLTHLIVEAGFGDPKLEDNMQLSESMGLFLQKTNIIRDYREDLDDGRSFWPKEIWSKYADSLSDFSKPENYEKGLDCISELVLNTMDHIKDVLVYLSSVYDFSSYNFCVIPQVMAIATLATVFRNEKVFETNVKIRKGTTCYLILKARTFEGACEIFSYYLRQIHHSCPITDANYIKIGIKCGELEQFLESLNPAPHVPPGATIPQTPHFVKAERKRKLDRELVPTLAIESLKCDVFLSLVALGFLGAIYSISS